jgi:hypothetical protein
MVKFAYSPHLDLTAPPSRFLTLRIIFDFKTSFSKIMPFVKKKAYVVEILKIFLN